MSKIVVGVSLTQEELEWVLDRIAKGKALNKADVLRMALREYIERDKAIKEGRYLRKNFDVPK